MELVVDKFIAELGEQLALKKLPFICSDTARSWLARKGYDPDYGARPLARLIQSEIKDKLSDEILFEKLEKGGRVSIDLDEYSLVFDYS